VGEDQNKYPGIYRAKVLGTDALETDKLGRIKAEVYPFMLGTVTALAAGVGDGIVTATLPWAIPAPSLFSGSGDGTGCFAVPDVGSYVWVFFENGDVHQPVYFAEAPNKLKGLPTERLVGYPDVKVLKTASGISVTINQLSGSEDIKITHPAGTSIQMDVAGNLTIVAGAATSITSAGTVGITAGGAITVTGATINLNP